MGRIKKYTPDAVGKKNDGMVPAISKAQWAKELTESIRIVESDKRKKLMVRAIELAWDNSTLMIAVLKKLVPDMRYIEADINLKQDDWVTRLEQEKENKKQIVIDVSPEKDNVT